MYNRHISISIIVLAFTSCSYFSKDYEISDEAYKAIPYSEEKILIFESDTYKRDTILITGTTHAMVRNGDGFSIAPDRYEHIRINYTTTKRPQERGLLYLGWVKNAYDLRFEFEAGHSQLFYNHTFYKSEYDNLPFTDIKVMNRRYTDVKIIHSSPGYEDRPERILNFYWSTSSGLLGWDTPNSKWRLIEIKK